MAVNPTGMATEEVTVMTTVVTNPAMVIAAVVIAAVVSAAMMIAAAVVTAAAVAIAATGVTAAMVAAATAAVMTALRLRRRIGRAQHQAGYASGGEAIDSKQGACRRQVRQEFWCSGPSVPDHFISASTRITRAPQVSATKAKYSHSDLILYVR
jgi:membrane protein implicated in regulation of membrane protease activity